MLCTPILPPPSEAVHLNFPDPPTACSQILCPPLPPPPLPAINNDHSLIRDGTSDIDISLISDINWWKNIWYTQNAGSPAYTQHWVLYTWDEHIMSISQVGKPLYEFKEDSSRSYLIWYQLNELDFVTFFTVQNLLKSMRLWSHPEEVGFCVY